MKSETDNEPDWSKKKKWTKVIADDENSKKNWTRICTN